MAGRCSACDMIAAAVVEWSKKDERHVQMTSRNLGTWAEYLIRTNCTTCQAIVSFLSNVKEADTVTVRSPKCTMAFSLDKGRFMLGGTPFCYSDERPDHVFEHAHLYLEVYPTAEHRFAGDGEYFVKVDRERINVGRISTWLRHCETEHSYHCAPGIRKKFPGPARMIDLGLNCLIENRDWPRYAALSYVWGTIPLGLITSQSNITALSQSGAISSGDLAATVRDAMDLARKLGFHYFWVDRLCIIQDDDDDKKSEIALMGDIYKNASLTLVAMDGDNSDHGIRGLSTSRHHNQFVLDASGIQLLGSPTRENSRNKLSWHRRAWTYQERLLSSRKLCFFNESYFWECSPAHWIEDISSEADDVSVDNFCYRSLSRTTNGVIENHPFADFHQYCELMEEYCTRRIGFDADALNACSAVIAQLRPKFLGGFHFGLPEFFFDIAMLWSPIKPMQRRPEFPSWSWLGWKNGAITHMPYANYYSPTVQYQNNTPIEHLRITPKIEWFRNARLFATDEFRKVCIDNSYHVWYEKAFSKNVTGWKKTGSTWNKQSLIDKSYEFRYPMPIGERINLRHELSCQEHCKPYLSLKTQRAFVKTRDIAGKSFLLQRTFHINVTDEHGKWVGILSSHITDASAHVPKQQREVIVISEARAQGTSLDSAYIEVRAASELSGINVYDFYNVLCIERRDGMSYRTAVGRIWKEGWKKLSVETVEIDLG